MDEEIQGVINALPELKWMDNSLFEMRQLIARENEIIEEIKKYSKDLNIIKNEIVEKMNRWSEDVNDFFSRNPDFMGLANHFGINNKEE